MQFFTTRLDLRAVSPICSKSREQEQGETNAPVLGAQFTIQSSTIQSRAPNQGMPTLSLGLPVSIEAVKLVLHRYYTAVSLTLI